MIEFIIFFAAFVSIISAIMLAFCFSRKTENFEERFLSEALINGYAQRSIDELGNDIIVYEHGGTPPRSRALLIVLGALIGPAIVVLIALFFVDKEFILNHGIMLQALCYLISTHFVSLMYVSYKWKLVLFTTGMIVATFILMLFACVILGVVFDLFKPEIMDILQFVKSLFYIRL
jgi:hypothetical protein